MVWEGERINFFGEERETSAPIPRRRAAVPSLRGRRAKIRRERKPAAPVGMAE
jgi:hypothetical protein